MDNQPAGGDPTPSQKPAQPRPRIGAIGLLLLLIATLLLGVFLFNGDRTKRSEIDYGFFREQLREGNVAELKIDGQKAYGKFGAIPARPAAVPKTEAEKDKDAAPGAEDTKATPPPELLQHFWTTLVPLVGEKLDEEILAKVGPHYTAAPITDSTGLLLMFYVAITLLLFLACG